MAKLTNNMKDLSEREISNIAKLSDIGAQFTYAEVTECGFIKGYFDCTIPVRKFLKKHNYHEYEKQPRGEKWYKKGYLISSEEVKETKVSLYHPKAKSDKKAMGDPRIWFYDLKSIVQPFDIIAIIYYSEALYVLDITHINLEFELSSNTHGKIASILTSIVGNFLTPNASELLEKLRILAKKGWIKGELNADTNLGRSTETFLGIKMNSNKAPDYKGIEIKSNRKKEKNPNRKNLFTKVPNWQISKFKSSQEIFDHFAYFSEKEQGMRLQCTMSTLKPNPQTLMLEVRDNLLVEKSTRDGDICAWPLEELHTTLLAKHAETFWVEAESRINADGDEEFRYLSVEYTKNPDVDMFDNLLRSGLITVDHLAKIRDNGTLKESPSFKIKPSALHILMPESKLYVLQQA